MPEKYSGKDAIAFNYWVQNSIPQCRSANKNWHCLHLGWCIRLCRDWKLTEKTGTISAIVQLLLVHVSKTRFTSWVRMSKVIGWRSMSYEQKFEGLIESVEQGREIWTRIRCNVLWAPHQVRLTQITIRLCPRGAQTCARLIFCCCDLDLGLMTLKPDPD